MTSLLAHQTTPSSLPSIQHSPQLSATGTHTVVPSLSLFASKHVLQHHSTNCSRTQKQKQVICMAHPRRVKMVAQQIRRELSDMLLRDTVLQQAVLPETALGADKYLSSLATISDVEVSGDLQVVKVYVSVYGDERGREIALEGLRSKNKYVRCELGKRMKLRMTPEVRFIEDDSLERGSRVIAVLERLKEERERKAQRQKESTNIDDHLHEDIQPTQMRLNHTEQKQPVSCEDEGWNIDEEDEDIIYIK